MAPEKQVPPTQNIESPFRVLFVCTADICRSPMAQLLFPLALGGKERETFEVISAGVQAYDGLPMDPPAAAELRRLGGNPAGFRSRELTDEASEAADLILTATREQRSIVLDRTPRALRRTFTLLEFAQPSVDLMMGGRRGDVVARAAAGRGNNPPAEYDIDDPFGGTADDHRRTAETISAAVAAIAARLTGRVVVRRS